MRLRVRAASFCAILLVIASAAELRAQERRDSTRRATATSAEEMHRIRRMWLEQRRLGQLGEVPPVYGSAVVGPPRAGTATGIVVGGGYGSLYRGSARLPLLDPRAFGFAEREGLPFPAYPPYGRFHDRFNPDAFGGAGWTDPLLFGVQEYDWGWWGPRRTYPGVFGWSDGGYGWYSAPPWSQSPADCVDLTVVLANGRAHRLELGLQSLGLADARDLDLAIDARLSEGSPVLLQGLDGRLIRIDPGTPIEDILVRPCGG
jgi:hypothetical protein